MQLGEATMRLAISVGRSEGDALVAAYKQMVLRQIASQIGEFNLRTMQLA
jgi:hypothetical protein